MSPAPQALSAVRCIWPVGATLGEGTLWSERQQALYFVDILGQRLHRYTPASGERRSWVFDEEISAVAERAAQPGLIVTLRHHFALFDPDTGALHKLHAPELERSGNRFNDGKCDARGRFWGGTMDFGCVEYSGALYRYDADGACTRHQDNVHISNGPTWSPDQTKMYFTETGHGEISVFDFDPETGTLSGKRPWLKFSAGDGKPDGMTTDADGRIWIAHWDGGCVTCHAPDARLLARIELPARNITNCAFGGPDLKTLYISSAKGDLSAAELEAQPLAGALFAVDLDVAGIRAGYFAG